MYKKVLGFAICTITAQVWAGGATLVTAGCPSLFAQDQVVLVFSDDLDATEATKVSNYRFSSPSGITVRSVTLQAGSQNSVVLSLGNSLTTGTTARVMVTGGKSATGQTIASQAFTFNVVDVAMAAQRIQACALPNGAINVYAQPNGGWKPTTGVRIVPYFSCQAAMGLISAWRMTGEASYLQTVREYLTWHDAHFNADGTVYDYKGTVANIVPTGDYDSTDSYGALYLGVLWSYYVATGDHSIFEARWDKIQLAVGAINLTLREDNLTWAKPTYKVKYTMDNVEVFQGFFAGAQLARVLGHTAEYAQWLAQAHATRNAVQQLLWDENHYLVNLGGGGPEPAYYPTGMATDMASVFVDDAAGSRVQTSWNWSKSFYMPNHVPAADMAIWSAWSAQRAGDRTGYNIAMARSLEVMFDQWFIAPDVGVLLQVSAEERPVAVLSHPTESMLIDGQLSEAVWSETGHLWFHPLGLTVHADNRQTYMQPPNTLEQDGSVHFGFANNDGILYVGVDASDKYLTSAAAAIDSDGLSHLNIRDAVDSTLFHHVGLTLSGTPGGGAVTGPTPLGVLADLSSGSWAWALKSGNNTLNNPADTDSGFTMEMGLDLTDARLGGYTLTNPTDVTFGMRYADMDGAAFCPWPWTNGAEGTMFQLSPGLQAAEYGVNTLRILKGKKPQARVPFDRE